MHPTSLKRWLRVAVAAALSLGLAAAAMAEDYLVTATKPDNLFVIDAQAHKVIKHIKLHNAGTGAQTVVPSPDGRRAYVVVNRWESVTGVDLDSGKEVFRADLSSGDERVKVPFTLALNPNGKELYVYESPVKLELGEYKVEPTRIAVFDTNAGLHAKPVRTFEAPRRIIMLFPSTDGKYLYGLGWDLYKFDAATGKLVHTFKILNWKRKNYGPPDVLDVWPQYEQTGIFTTLYYATRTDKPANDPAAYKTGLITLNLKTGKFSYQDFENTSVVIFSAVVSPKDHNDVYAVYTTLSKIRLNASPGEGKLVDRIDLPHTFYAINISSDGKYVYLGGTMNDVAVYDTATMKQVADIHLPGGGDQALSSLRIIHRRP